MQSDCNYSYPLNTEHPYTTETFVKVVKGTSKGRVGKISSMTQSGIYFIKKQSENGDGTIESAPDGPFLPDEFELLQNSTLLPE
ncbi:MAG TPA: hypothetical protein ACFE0H_10405 [Elainellaceae cyanobacterium]